MNKITQIAFSIPGGQSTDPTVNLGSIGGIPSGVGGINPILQWALTLIFVFAGIAAILFVIWGGISWITSAGEKEKLEGARKKVLYALIGLIIIFASYLIVRTVGSVLGVDPFNVGASKTPTGQRCSDAFPHGTCSDQKDCILYNGHYSCHFD
jgi:hypothetical protein